MRSYFQIPLLLLLLVALPSLSRAKEEISISVESSSDDTDLIVPNLEDQDANGLQVIANQEKIPMNSEKVGYPVTKEDESDTVEVLLPVLEVQFVCNHDYRPPVNASDYFLKQYHDLYNQLLPNDEILATKSSLHHLERFSRMSDISPTKWYYSDCNMTSPQLLTTLKVRGKGTLQHSAVNLNAVELVNDETTIKDFFSQHVCTNMTEFRAYVESPKLHHQSFYYSTSSSPKQSMTFDHIDHSLLLLCGDEDLVYYEEGPPDASFLFFGFFVGFLMVSMIATELKKYDSRPHPLGEHRRGEYDDVPAGGLEVEMV